MKKNSFLEGAFIATLAIVVTKILGVLYVIPFYSIIGEQGGALYGYAYSIYNFFLIISTAGIPLAISKLTSELTTLGKQREKIRMYHLARNYIIVFSIISFLLCFIFAPQIANIIIGDISGGNTIDDVAYVIRAVSFALLIIPFLSIARGYLQGHKYITQPSISQVIEQLIRVAVIVGGSYIAYKVLHLSLTKSIGIALFGACLGGLGAYFYLLFVMKKNKKNLKTEDKNQALSMTNKEILKKILWYAIPFILVSVINNLYNTVDMILIIRTLGNLGYSAPAIETISSVFTTWGHKLNTIVTSIATGLMISLIPNIVSSYVAKKKEEVNLNFNKAIQIVLCIIVPITIFLSIMSKEVWSLFYGESYYGPLIFKFSVLIASFDSMYMVINSTLQGINKYKLVLSSVGIGLLINAVLDIPLMILCHKLGIHAFYGATIATIIGYIISLTISIISLKKKDGFSYSKTIKIIPRVVLTATLMIIISTILQKLIVIDIKSRLLNIPYLIFYALINIGIYIVIMKPILKNIVGEDLLKKIFKKKNK